MREMFHYHSCWKHSEKSQQPSDWAGLQFGRVPGWAGGLRLGRKDYLQLGGRMKSSIHRYAVMSPV